MQKLSLILIATFLWGCGSGNKPETKTMNNHIQDVHSFSRPEEAVMKHLSLDLAVNFDSKTLAGTATIDIENKSGADTLMLDVRDLTISEVLIDGEKTSFEIGSAKPYLGSPMAVVIKPNTKQVKIRYTTSPDAAALQWLEPEQTAGGKSPFLFTQSQAVLARTWIPLQDSPGIKFTYDAKISVPKGMMALMSAENDTALKADGVYTSKMPQPISSYLMALAVGDLQFKSYDDRSGVFAEPSLIEKAAYEFADLPKMISSAEELYGPYAWGRYDVLVLPPSFPFGGMENPRITFATPTIIAGDRSLVALIAHELAHSWSGNLVTNATWNDFWLNEGFTVYFETRIMEKIYGRNYADMLTLLSLGDLKNTIKEMGNTSRDTHLYLELKDRDPDDGMSDIAYEKGRFFLTSIEEAVGRERWDAFLNKYFTTFAFQSMDTKGFLNYLEQELIKGDEALRKKINADAWVYGPGLPASCPVITSVELDKARAAAMDFIAGKQADQLNTKDFTTHHWLYFMRSMKDSLNTSRMAALDKQFGFTNSTNAEIQCEWYQCAIATDYKVAFPNMERFMIAVGRRKFIKPLYAALSKTPENLKIARDIYAKARPGYHSVAVQTMDEMLK